MNAATPNQCNPPLTRGPVIVELVSTTDTYRAVLELNLSTTTDYWVSTSRRYALTDVPVVSAHAAYHPDTNTLSGWVVEWDTTPRAVHVMVHPAYRRCGIGTALLALYPNGLVCPWNHDSTQFFNTQPNHNHPDYP